MTRARLGVFVCLIAGCVGLTAQPGGQTPPQQPAPSAQTGNPQSGAPQTDATQEIETSEGKITVQVRQIVAPVTVLDRSGGVVDGIESGRFHLYDNNKAQNINVDITTQALSMVVAVQQSDRVDAVLSQIHRIGPLIQPLVTGDNGEAAIISFDSRILEKTGFTNDQEKLEKAIQSIHSGNTPSRMIDAVEHAIGMLRARPDNRRRVILLISETRDVSSEARLRETLIAAQLANISIYSVDISRIVTSLTSQRQPGGVSPLPASAANLPGPGPTTPTSVAQATQAGNRAEFVPMLKEIYLGAKRIFVENPVEVFTEGTGGAQFSFKRERALEEAITSVGRELHNQYLITYTPNNQEEDGFHQIRVDVDLPNLVVRTRPGYFLGGK